jgi:hypothetical protein
VKCFGKEVVEKNHNTHFKFKNFLFLSEIMQFINVGKNVVERGRLQMTIWRMLYNEAPPLSLSLSLSLSEYVILIAFPQQQ